MSSGRELNQRPFGSQASAQSTEPYQPGLVEYFLNLWMREILKAHSFYDSTQSLEKERKTKSMSPHRDRMQYVVTQQRDGK